MPGPTETDFFRRADMEDTKIGQMDKDDPAEVAEQAFDAVMRGKKKIVTGSAKTKAQGLANKVLPDSAAMCGDRCPARVENGVPGTGRGRATVGQGRLRGKRSSNVAERARLRSQPAGNAS
jgi:hypothetical protein